MKDEKYHVALVFYHQCFPPILAPQMFSSYFNTAAGKLVCINCFFHVCHAYFS